MPARDLLREPMYQPEQLGQPIPASMHAVSVALPRWQDVVGYEEKKPEVMSKLASGYPRFVVHPVVIELGKYLTDGKSALPFPSSRVAQDCAEFLQRTAGVKGQ